MNEPTIYGFPQYGDEWHAVRRGLCTASKMKEILSPKKLEFSKGADGYICELIGDIIDPMYPREDSYASAAMKNGTMLEPQARAACEFEFGAPVQQVGFIVSACGRWGCSPDGLIGTDAGLELKSPLPATHVEYLLHGGLPDEHRMQVHGSMIVSRRRVWHYASFCPGFRTLFVKIEWDATTDALAKALEQYWARRLEIEEILGFTGLKAPAYVPPPPEPSRDAWIGAQDGAPDSQRSATEIFAGTGDALPYRDDGISLAEAEQRAAEMSANRGSKPPTQGA